MKRVYTPTDSGLSRALPSRSFSSSSSSSSVRGVRWLTAPAAFAMPAEGRANFGSPLESWITKHKVTDRPCYLGLSFSPPRGRAPLKPECDVSDERRWLCCCRSYSPRPRHPWTRPCSWMAAPASLSLSTSRSHANTLAPAAVAHAPAPAAAPAAAAHKQMQQRRKHERRPAGNAARRPGSAEEAHSVLLQASVSGKSTRFTTASGSDQRNERA